MARRAVVTDVPMEIDTYRTVGQGVLQIFSVSHAKVGDVIDGHTVVYNRVVSGDAHMASSVTYIAIKM
jgi:expansin (peptidoglycan-binding protein)